MISGASLRSWLIREVLGGFGGHEIVDTGCEVAKRPPVNRNRLLGDLTGYQGALSTPKPSHETAAEEWPAVVVRVYVNVDVDGGACADGAS